MKFCREEENLKSKLLKANLDFENSKFIIKSRILVWSAFPTKEKKVLQFIMGQNIPHYINK